MWSLLYWLIFQGSWRISLRNSFKNFRRKGNSSGEVEPPSKRGKWQVEDLSEIDKEAYEEAVENLKEALKKKSKDRQKVIKTIMETTRAIRCQWIQEHPMIAEVLEKFPCLAYSRWVRYFIVLCVASNKFCVFRYEENSRQ